jgi:CBS-domain-containing membrane protein
MKGMNALTSDDEPVISGGVIVAYARRPNQTSEIVQITRSEYDRLLRERAAFAEVSRAVDIFLAATTCQVMSPDVCAFVAGNVTGIVRRFDEAEAKREPVVYIIDAQKEPETP